MIRRICPVIAIVLGLLFVMACSDDTKVGSKDLTEFDEKAGDRLGETTTTTAKKGGNPKSTTTTTAPVTTTTAPAQAQVTTTTVQPVALTVKIVEQGNGYDPTNIRVYVGSKVKFINTGDKPRTIHGRQGEFALPTIQPGATLVYTFDKVTPRTEFTDERPYAVGYLEVLPR